MVDFVALFIYRAMKMRHKRLHINLHDIEYEVRTLFGMFLVFIIAMSVLIVNLIKHL